MSDKWQVARVLREIARYLELSEPNPFKTRAYERAATAIEATEEDLAALAGSGQLPSIAGVGKGIAPVIAEVVTTGSSSYLEELRGNYPAGIFDLMRVPALGLKKVGLLHSELGIGTLDELEAAARAGRIAKLKGFGSKTEQKILEGIARARKRESFHLLPVCLEIAESLRETLASIDEISDAEVTGSVRRRLEIARNVNIAIAAADPERAMRAIVSRDLLESIEEVAPLTLHGAARDGIEVLLHVAKPADFGATVLTTTGGTEFVSGLNAKINPEGFELREGQLFHRGKHVAARTENEVFEKIGIAPVAPELREDGSALKRKSRARLLELTDIRGTFHIHTTFSDGKNSVREMLDTAVERGFEYAGISDHSQNAFYARGLDEQALKLQKREIDAYVAAEPSLHVFRGTEADILNDGTMDYGPAILSRFDFVIASVHSRFGMEKEAMTDRILRALDDPFVTFLGHLTGRLLLSRDGYSIDFDRVFDRAAERAVIIEINGSPRRLELDWRLVRRAVDRGVTLSIHPDAHSIREMSYVISGAWVARKGGLSPKHIFNTRPLDEVKEYLEKRRAKALG